MIALGFIMATSGDLPAVRAGVMADSTRVIYLEGQKERTLMVANTNAYPVLVQVWVNQGEAAVAPQAALSSMIVLPPVFRLQPGAMQGLRVVFNGDPLPEDRESVFWLNLYEVPPTRTKKPTDVPKIAVAMNTQMKIFYRPKNLPVPISDLGSLLRFELQESRGAACLMVHNPTPYHASFSSLSQVQQGQEWSIMQDQDMMVRPFSRRCYALARDRTVDPSAASVRFTLIDDAGQFQEGTSPMTRPWR